MRRPSSSISVVIPPHEDCSQPYYTYTPPFTIDAAESSEEGGKSRMANVKNSCGPCAKTFRTMEKYLQHVVACPRKGRRRYTCSQCDMAFNQHASITLHTQVLHPSVKTELLECSICPKSYPSSYELFLHQSFEHKKSSEIRHCTPGGESAWHTSTYKQPIFAPPHKRTKLGQPKPTVVAADTMFKTPPKPRKPPTTCCIRGCKSLSSAQSDAINHISHVTCVVPIAVDAGLRASKAWNSKAHRTTMTRRGLAQYAELRMCNACVVKYVDDIEKEEGEEEDVTQLPTGECCQCGVDVKFNRASCSDPNHASCTANASVILPCASRGCRVTVVPQSSDSAKSPTVFTKCSRCIDRSTRGWRSRRTAREKRAEGETKPFYRKMKRMLASNNEKRLPTFLRVKRLYIAFGAASKSDKRAYYTKVDSYAARLTNERRARMAELRECARFVSSSLARETYREKRRRQYKLWRHENLPNIRFTIRAVVKKDIGKKKRPTGSGRPLLRWLTCPTCDMRILSHKAYRIHRRKVHNIGVYAKVKDRQYKCPHCVGDKQRMFASKAALLNHSLAHFELAPVLVCPHCPMIFVNRSPLIEHVGVVHGQEKRGMMLEDEAYKRSLAAMNGVLWRNKIPIVTQLLVDSCPDVQGGEEGKGEEVTAAVQQDVVVVTTSAKSQFFCAPCDLYLDDRSAWNQHQQTTHSLPSFAHMKECPVCPAILPSQKMMDEHLITAHKGMKVERKGERVVEKKENSSPSKPSITTQKCMICREAFTDFAKLQDHRLTCFTHLSCQQPSCLRANAAPFDVYRHLIMHLMNDHKKRLEFVCEVEHCVQRFAAVGKYQRHLGEVHNRQIRNSMKPSNATTLSCHLCAHKSKSASDHRIHGVDAHGVHFDVIKCSECDKEFNTRTELRKHYRVHRVAVNCPICNHKLASRAYLFAHMKRLHPNQQAEAIADKDKVKCDQCPNLFLTESARDIHVKKKHDTDGFPFKCEGCPWVYRTEEGRNIHIQREHIEYMDAEVEPIKLYTCTICRMRSWKTMGNSQKHKIAFATLECFIVHNLKTHNIMPHDELSAEELSDCPPYRDVTLEELHGVNTQRLTPTARVMLCRYTKRNYDVETFKCDRCPMLSFAECHSLFVHNRAVHGHITTFECTEPGCTVTYPTRSELGEHRQMAHDHIRCAECGTMLSKFEILKTHILRKHAPAEALKPFACSEDGCEKRFWMESEMTQHRRVHNAFELYACDRCSMRYATKRGLFSHQQAHHFNTPSRPYRCDICKIRTFTRLENLQEHIQRLHIGIDGVRGPKKRKHKPIGQECPNCRKRFARQQSLNLHQREEHPQMVTNPCPDCPAFFTKGTSLRIHQRKVHGLSIPNPQIAVNKAKRSRKWTPRNSILRWERELRRSMLRMAVDEGEKLLTICTREDFPIIKLVTPLKFSISEADMQLELHGDGCDVGAIYQRCQLDTGVRKTSMVNRVAGAINLGKGRPSKLAAPHVAAKAIKRARVKGEKVERSAEKSAIEQQLDRMMATPLDLTPSFSQHFGTPPSLLHNTIVTAARAQALQPQTQQLQQQTQMLQQQTQQLQQQMVVDTSDYLHNLPSTSTTGQQAYSAANYFYQ